MQVQFVRFRQKILPSFRISVSNRVIQCNIAQCCVHVYLIFEATDSKQYRPQNASYEVSNTNNFGSVSNSLERLAAASGCMSSITKNGRHNKKM